MSNKNIDAIVEDSISDDDIKKYFPNALILTYPELANYKTIEDILKKDGYFFLLYLDSPNKGHWCLVSYTPKGAIEFFDSYAYPIDDELLFVDNCKKRKQLGQDKAILSRMFNKTKKDVYFNDIKYQQLKDGINTCGRHCIFRLLLLKKYGMNLNQYEKTMEKLKEESGMSYDKLVSSLISIVN